MSGNQYCLLFIQSVCAESGVWAAWAQALLSFAGILYAARVTRSDARRTRHRHLGVYQSMLQLAVMKAHDARRVVHRATGVHLIDSDATFWPRMKDSFAAIPLHDVPDPLLVDVIVLATEACSKMDSLYEKLSSPNYVVHALDGTSVDWAVLTLDECVSRAFSIRFSEQPVRRFLLRAAFAVAAPIWKRIAPYVMRRMRQPPTL